MWDSFLAIFKISLKSIFANKMRAALTSLGIIIGVAAVITVLAVGAATKKSITDRFSNMGTNILFLRQPWDLDESISSPKDVTMDDVMAIREVPGVEAAAPYIQKSFEVKYKNTSVGLSVLATDTDIFSAYDWSVARGREFTEREITNYSQVMVLGDTSSKTIFGDVDPLNKTVVLDNIPFTVVGIVKKTGSTGFGFNIDEGALIPYTTSKVKMGSNNMSNRRALDRVVIKVYDFDQIENMKVDIANTVRNTHRIHPLGKDDFQLDDMASFVEQAKSTASTISLFLGVIGVISLIVGGIGVMNIMLVSVTERTREIGIRMAIGATSWNIRMQFLGEAVTLSCMGGLIGILLGVIFTLFVSKYMSLQTHLSLWAILVSAGFSAATGVFFGFYPAYKASKLTPIDALRYE
ncbi:ABC transporter permease [Candidatus Avelusimicrobium luingense]|uniref:ABC transporter permease n=1 Tax=Candidatus Avelusimicrobium luingense TaxID=3416211 RepID=UPI003D0C8EF7